ncbi:uncharacterized protein LOC112564505 isoform X2 [Pomacea canaliculata]|uniref:uncharacterized protein LOC112564505 isoform X2 n=1 Tax=Pomacea canaliculata TaxID=400727 RepID=UPI000D728D72|nr:uncharacterized protein LOC112564505 isoform X2 [Pomacea canaliculata]
MLKCCVITRKREGVGDTREARRQFRCPPRYTHHKTLLHWVSTQACEYSNDGFGFYSLGTQDSATFSTEASELHLTYSATDQGLLRTTQVTLVCDHSQEKSIEMKPVQSSLFEFTLTSRYCCPQPISAGLSGGSVVLIVLVAMLLVYIVGGVVFQVGVRKASGKEIIPNYTWWSSLPALIKDGMKFTVSCGRWPYSKV